jgi:hypothetical protein
MGLGYHWLVPHPVNGRDHCCLTLLIETNAVPLNTLVSVLISVQSRGVTMPAEDRCEREIRRDLHSSSLNWAGSKQVVNNR